MDEKTKNQINSLKQKLKDADLTIDNLEDEIQRLKTKNELFEKEKTKLQKIIQEKNETLQKEEETIYNLNYTIDELTIKLEKQKDTIIVLKNEKESIKLKEGEFNEKLRIKISEIQKRELEIIKLMEEKDDLQKLNNNLELQNIFLEDQIRLFSEREKNYLMKKNEEEEILFNYSKSQNHPEKCFCCSIS